jgi:hypothetical protein
VLVRLEDTRGVAAHLGAIAYAKAAPDVITLKGVTYRYIRTDGLWDRKVRVYKEASVKRLRATWAVKAAGTAMPAIPMPPTRGDELNGAPRRRIPTTLAAKAAFL